MKRMALAASLSALTCVAGCGGSSPHLDLPAPYASLASAFAAAPSCQSLLGKTLTKAMYDTSCKDNTGDLLGTAELECKEGLMIAFGNLEGGIVGQPIKLGDLATSWPGCTS